MATYDLPPAAAAEPDRPADLRPHAHLADEILARNVRWFCRLRWIIIGLLAAYGGLSLIPGAFEPFHLAPRAGWALACAAVLVGTNLAFLWHARRLARRPSARGAVRSLWTQIATDLVVLTAVVHFMGSLETFIPFAYLFHVVLACIFLSRRASLAVAGLACGLYTALVVAEEAGLLPLGGMYASHAIRRRIASAPWAVGFSVLTAVGIILVVRYLASYLAAMVRERDRELAATNRRLVEMEGERTRHMLRTTHELKAPFAAIHANVQLLMKGYCGALPDPAADVLGRIDARSRRLAVEIQEMLQLANLRSESRRPPAPEPLDLAATVEACAAQVRPTAQERGVAIEVEAAPARTLAVEEHVRMLLVNLLTNAVAYSHEGGRVEVRLGPAADGRPAVAIRDHGIGIPPEKLPRIFDEYYRADEAVRHNPESSGLGLAIAAHVARAEGIHVRVASEPGRGTTFELEFPAPEGPAGGGVRTQGDARWPTY